MASRRSRNLFACFPPLDPQRVRRTQCQAPPSWSACRGCWYVTEHDALAMMSGDLVPDTDGEAHRVCYRCPKLRNVIIYNGQMELRRCSVCCRKDRFENHQKCKFDCERRFDSMMRETTEEKWVDQGKFTERYIRAICAGGMRLGLSCHKLESDAMMSMSRELIQIGIDAQFAQCCERLTAQLFLFTEFDCHIACCLFAFVRATQSYEKYLVFSVAPRRNDHAGTFFSPAGRSRGSIPPVGCRREPVVRSCFMPYFGRCTALLLPSAGSQPFRSVAAAERRCR